MWLAAEQSQLYVSVLSLMYGWLVDVMYSLCLWRRTQTKKTQNQFPFSSSNSNSSVAILACLLVFNF